MARYREADAAVQDALAAGRGGADVLADDLGAAYAEALAAMADDLNTPVALAAAYRGAGAVLAAHRAAPLSAASAERAVSFLDRVNALLGVVRSEYGEGAVADEGGAEDDAFAARVEALLADRTEARAAKDWARADAIRDEIDGLGVVVMDTPAGPEWRRA